MSEERPQPDQEARPPTASDMNSDTAQFESTNQIPILPSETDYNRQTLALERNAPTEFDSAKRDTVMADPTQLAEQSSQARPAFDERLERIRQGKSQAAKVQLRSAKRRKRARLMGCLIGLGGLGALVLALVVLAFFLPPLDEQNPVLERLREGREGQSLSSQNRIISNLGLSVQVQPNDAGEDFRVNIKGMSAEDYRLGATPPRDWACPLFETLPRPAQDIRGGVFSLASFGVAPQQVGLNLAVPPDQNPSLLDLYGWYADEWLFIPSQKSLQRESFITDLPTLPSCIVYAQIIDPLPVLAIDLNLGQTFNPALGGDINRLYVRGMQPTANGTLQGVLPASVPNGDSGFRVIPLIANYSDPAIIDVDSLRAILSDPALRASHSANIAAFAESNGFSGVAIDYRGLPPELRNAFSDLVRNLARALAINNRTLIVALPMPQTQGETWSTGAYDWRVIGQFADETLLMLPPDPLAYLPGGEVDQVLAWAVGEINRYKLSVGISARSIETAPSSPARYVNPEMAWEGVAGLHFDPAQTLPPNEDVQVNLAGFYPLQIGLDSDLRATFVHYGATETPLRTFWLSTPPTLSHRIGRGLAFNLGGAALFDLHHPALMPQVANVLPAFQVGSLLDMNADEPLLRWEISNAGGDVLLTEFVPANTPIIYQAGTENVTFSVFYGDSLLASATLTVDPNAAAPEVSQAPQIEPTTEPEPITPEPETPQVEPTNAPDPVTPEPEIVEPEAEATSETESLGAETSPTPSPTVATQAPVSGIFAPGQSSNPTAAPLATATPNATATPIPTINPPVAPYDGQRLIINEDFEMGAHFTGYYEGIEEKWAHMQRAGMNWIKIQLRFEPGMNADDYGWQVQYNHENGFKILWGVVGEPEHLLDAGYYQEYADFVGRLAEIGSDAIEVWNEVNLDREWPQGRVDPAMYTEFLRVSYEEIKARNPNTLVISAGLAPTGFFGGRCTPQGCDDDVYYEGMARAGADRYMDCVGAHYNEGIISPVLTSGDPRDTDSGTRYLQSNTDRAFRPFGGRVPVCYTELGYLTSEGFGRLPDNFAWASNVTLAQHASWLATAALINQQSGNVRLMIVWNLDYDAYTEFDPHGGYAMIRPDGACPACDTLGSILAEE